MGVDRNVKFEVVEATKDLLSSSLLSANDDSVIFHPIMDMESGQFG